MPPPDQGSGGGAGGMPNFGGAEQFRGFGGMPGGGGGGTRTFHFSTNGGGNPGNFAFSDPESIFADFFRQQSGGGGLGDDDIPGLGGSFRGFGGAGMGGAPRTGRRTSSSRFDGMNVNGAGRQATPEVTVVEKPLPVSLEDVFKGTTKNMRIKRKKFDQATGKQMVEDRILEVPIKPGLKAGSKIKFKDVGDQVEGGTQDLHFIVEEVSN
jgi:DnaJ family protein B protein 4